MRRCRLIREDRSDRRCRLPGHGRQDRSDGQDWITRLFWADRWGCLSHVPLSSNHNSIKSRLEKCIRNYFDENAIVFHTIYAIMILGYVC